MKNTSFVSVARWLTLGLVAAGGSALSLASCSSDPAVVAPGDAAAPDVAIVREAEVDAEPTFCQTQNLPALPFATGPYGVHRGDLADDFTLTLADGATFNFKQHFTGCDSYVFVPDSLLVSSNDPTSLWASDADLAQLVKQSPKNAHYFFMSNRASAAVGKASAAAMQVRVDHLLASLSEADAAHWGARLHVVAEHAQDLDVWMAKPYTAHLFRGFAIDRSQRIRGVGNLADIKRYDATAQWPWKGNLAYATNEVVYMNAEASRRARLDADGATVIDLWKGEVLSEFAETDVQLPAAQQMAGFDTLEIEVTQRCPNPDKAEEDSNCGAWDYLAYLFLRQPDPGDAGASDAGPATKDIEVARFITSYHRETHWVVDASPMLALLKAGGMQHFRWYFATPWNKQPTGTQLSLRLSNQKKGYAPVQATFLYEGRGFNSKYNDGRGPVKVPIPAAAKRVELWAIITGHGGENDNCAEFCNHQHAFQVNAKSFLREFKTAATNDGCMKAMMTEGMTPNQAGTWWLGRGGWCPGAPVAPWVVDVTKEITPGQTATVSYEGMYKNSAPPPDNSGNIVMSSYLVVYQ